MSAITFWWNRIEKHNLLSRGHRGIAGAALFSQAATAAVVDISSMPTALTGRLADSLTFGDNLNPATKTIFQRSLTFNVAQFSNVTWW